MELEFDKARWSQDEEGLWLSLRVKAPALARRFVAGMKPVLYIAKLSEHRNRRSLDANAYLWVLIGKIADKITRPKDEVYRDMLKAYGQGGVVKIPHPSVKNFEREFPYHEKHESLPDEERAQYYRFWVGSSKYDTEEMAKLIDGVIEEAKALGIETATPEELARMKEEWGRAQADQGG